MPTREELQDARSVLLEWIIMDGVVDLKENDENFPMIEFLELKRYINNELKMTTVNISTNGEQ